MHRKARWLIWSSYVVLWTALLVMPVRAINTLPGTDVLEGYRYFVAKSLHVAAYALMTVLSGWLSVSPRLRFILVFFLMAHATVTEMIQLTFPELGRLGDLHDVAFDHTGIAIGLFLSWKWWVKSNGEKTGRG